MSFALALLYLESALCKAISLNINLFPLKTQKQHNISEKKYSPQKIATLAEAPSLSFALLEKLTKIWSSKALIGMSQKKSAVRIMT